MKRQGQHPEKQLSALQIKQKLPSGRYTDGNGLYLVVDPSGAKRWILRVVVQGRRRDIGLGGVSLVSLADARETATSFRKIAREGGDPLTARRESRKIIPTFTTAAEIVHAEHEVSWKNPKHAQQWINTLKQYAYPVIGDYRVDSIDTPAVLRVLSPIWLKKPETARRVLQRIKTILNWAKAAGYRTGDNPVEGITKGLPKQGDNKKHFATMPYAKVAAFIKALDETNSSPMAKWAFEFLILAAARTSEVLQARWDEIDLEAKLWTVPAERMKAKREHRVPLSDRCLEILKAAYAVSADEGFVFISAAGDRPLSNMVFLAILKRMEIETTAHGFRSSFRDWAAEETSFPREVAEMALAHTITNKVEAAYRRGDLLEKRREMMQAWSGFVAGGRE
ncbi:site-specific integrase [Mesorhizobium sp. L103C105A0]|uniref:tyrosine-type recombinase/integrase n=1 Tax=Mesorhizobium sp. L103C105A0 TaxID=1287074 RepID=UPI0003D0243A|nr:site-specific integrase [Mesorhizobium sp. L103C105A0]ESZ78385.1 integrase [Mesorhizobium sp. L103C105A0]